MIWNWELQEPKSLIFQQETEPLEGTSESNLCIKGDKNFDRAWGSTLKAYVTGNQTSRRLLPMFPIEKTYILVPEEDLKNLIEESGWEGFYVRYPEAKSYVSMSSVGFNAQKTKAVLTMTYSCGTLCMEGTYYLMEKKHEKWVEARLSHVTSCKWAS